MVIAMVVARQSPWQPRTDATLVTRYLYSKFCDNRPTTLPVLAYSGVKMVVAMVVARQSPW